MVRAANTGVSAVIDAARARARDSCRWAQAGYLDAPLPPPLPPTLYARTGDLAGRSLLLLFCAGLALLARRRAQIRD